MKILIVDDNTVNLALLEALLGGNGYKTYSAKNGAEGLKLAAKHKFSLIISDILMPVMDGFTFCRECKKDDLLKNIPFIFYTATYTSMKDEEFALSLGANKFILKPQDPDVFMEIIEEVLKDIKEDNYAPPAVHEKPEEIVLKEYNSALIRKLEDKMAQTEEAGVELRLINAKLQKEIEEHKRTEEALKVSEEKFRTTFEDASVGMCLISLDGILMLANNALSGMLGYTIDELLSKRFSELIHMDDARLNGNWMHKMIFGETGVNRFESRLLHKNGDIVYSDTNTALIKDSGSKPLFFVTHLINITDKKLAEELLTISGTRYRRLFESAKDGIIILDAELGIILDVNPFLVDMLNLPYEEIIGKSIWSIKCLKQIVEDKYKFSLLQEKEYVHIENLSIETNGGRNINIEFISNTYTVNHDKVVQFNLRDITERKLMEKEIQESEERFRMIFDNVFDGICIYVEDPDPDKRKLIECNERYAAMAGRSREELLARSYTHDLQVTIEADANDIRLDSLKKNREYRGSFSWIRPDGKENYIEYVGRPITWRGKAYSIGIDRDVTERKQAEKELNKLSSAVEQSPASVVITDTLGNIEYVNKKVTEITGYQPGELINKNPRIFSSGNKSRDDYKAMWDTILAGKEWQGELENKKRNGEVFWESASISPIFNEKGKITHFIAIKEDITEQKRIMQELIITKEKAEQSDKLKTEFLAQMSHEIRTPMNAIISFTNLLKDDYFENPSAELLEILASISTAGNRIIRTVDLILNASELQVGTYKPTFTKINLEEKILAFIQLDFSKLAQQKGLHLSFNNNLPSTVVWGDDYSISQIFINLIANAIKFTDKGSIEILIDKDGNDNIFVAVTDTGIGISDEYLPNLFKEFMQEERGYSRRYEGNGLGLSLVKRYCDLNGIEVTVKSEKGKGSTFRIIFPAALKR